MASLLTLRVLIGASLGLGTLDVLWINLSLGPQVREVRAPAAAVLGGTPAEEPPASAVLARDTVPARDGDDVFDDVFDDRPDDRSGAARDTQVFFATTRAELTPAARGKLAELAASLGPTGTLVLEGHADHRGTEAFNRALSAQRATAVQDYLAERGVPRTRIRIAVAGESEATTVGALWRDRRVDIQLIGGP